MMPNILDQFFFDVNYGCANDSVFTLVDTESTAPFPPIMGYFLLLDNTNFLLLDGTDLTLL
jgi:hypothetical protein